MTKDSKMPTPAERPDLYDYADCREIRTMEQTGVRLPERLQKMMDAKKALARAAEKQNKAED